MTAHPAIESLSTLPDVSVVSADQLDDYLTGSEKLTAVFITGDPFKRLETADVAVVLREMLAIAPGQLQVAIIPQADEAAVKPRAAVLMTPSVAFFAGPEHLETIPKIQDWSIYAEKLPQLLSRARQALAVSA